MIYKHKAKVKNGKLELYNKDNFTADYKKFEGQEVYISIGIEKSSRSNNQNKYYWGVILKILGDELGYEPDEIHEAMKYKFLNKEIVVGNNKLKSATTTTALSTQEFEIYLGKIKVWASRDLGIILPNPNEVSY